MRPDRKGPRLGLMAVVVLVLISACDLPPPEGAVAVPCEGGAGTMFELGPVSRSGERYGEFTTSGSTIWVTARLPPTGGFLPETTRTGIEFGFANNPPSYNSRTGEEDAEIEADVSVEEGWWSPLELSAGQYWLWSTNGAEVVTLKTCTQGAISDPVPATFED